MCFLNTRDTDVASIYVQGKKLQEIMILCTLCVLVPLKCYGPKFIPECIVYSIPAFEVLKHYLTHGVAKLDIPCHEPLHIVKTYDIRARDEYDNNMQLYVDVEIRGLTKFEINEVR